MHCIVNTKAKGVNLVKKLLLILFLSTAFISCVHACDEASSLAYGPCYWSWVPTIFGFSENLSVNPRGQKGLDAFFAKIKRGQQDGASSEDRKYWYLAQRLIIFYFRGAFCWYNVSTLPSEIGELTNLEKIYLDDGELASLPSAIGELTRLCELYLRRNKFTSLPSEIGRLTGLKKLDLNGNKLTSLPSEIGELTHLEMLNLSENKFILLPPEIGKLTDLKELDLSSDELTCIPEEIGELTNLEMLNLTRNKLTSLPSGIVKLAGLCKLLLGRNEFSTLPLEIVKMTGLKELNLTNNRLALLPKEIGEMTNLKILYLTHNRLTLLPKEIGRMINLKILYLDANELTLLPKEMGKLTNLDRFDIDHNCLATVPPEIFRLKLSFFHAFGNPIKYLPKEFFGLGRKSYSKCTDLAYYGAPCSDRYRSGFYRKVVLARPPVQQPDRYGTVTLSHPQEQVWLRDEFRRNPRFKNRIKKFKYIELLEGTDPPKNCVVEGWPTKSGAINSGNRVVKEFVSREQLLNFMSEFEIWGDRNGELEEVVELSLQGFQLREVPPFVFECKKLERLFLEDNEIEVVPEEIGKLENLNFLSLGNNEIHQLPMSLGKLTELRGLVLDANPLDVELPIPNLEYLKYLEFISLDTEVAQRLRLELIKSIPGNEMIDGGSVFVRPPIPPPDCHFLFESSCVIS